MGLGKSTSLLWWLVREQGDGTVSLTLPVGRIAQRFGSRLSRRRRCGTDAAAFLARQDIWRHPATRSKLTAPFPPKPPAAQRHRRSEGPFSVGRESRPSNAIEPEPPPWKSGACRSQTNLTARSMFSASLQRDRNKVGGLFHFLQRQQPALPFGRP